MQGPYNVNKEGSGDMYPKGGVMHNMIRTIIDDDDKWRNILRGLNKEYYHKTVNYSDIVNYVSKHSGIDLSKTFEQFVQHRGIPTLEINVTPDKSIAYRWVSEVEGFDMPIHISLANGKKVLIKPTQDFKVLRAPGATKDNIVVDTFNYYVGVTIQ